jgi:hypothetical protein
MRKIIDDMMKALTNCDGLRTVIYGSLNQVVEEEEMINQLSPQPWRYNADGNDVRDAEDDCICDFYGDTTKMDKRVITASPRLYELLKSMGTAIAGLAGTGLVPHGAAQEHSALMAYIERGDKLPGKPDAPKESV